MTSLLWQFSYLQVLDYLTTIAFLLIGVQEGNPVVRLCMNLAPTPMLGLAAIKLAALLLGAYCLKLGKDRLLSRINVMFAMLVAWNLVALILGAARSGA
ncbi:MAG: DUF5658 family protein [Acidobacteriota bacterium]